MEEGDDESDDESGGEWLNKAISNGRARTGKDVLVEACEESESDEESEESDEESGKEGPVRRVWGRGKHLLEEILTSPSGLWRRELKQTNKREKVQGYRMAQRQKQSVTEISVHHRNVSHLQFVRILLWSAKGGRV